MSRLRERAVPIVLVLGRGYSPPQRISWMEIEDDPQPRARCLRKALQRVSGRTFPPSMRAMYDGEVFMRRADRYSQRNATLGSTPAARRAGR